MPDAGADVRVCERDGEPLVFTTEFPGAEYLCVVCDGHEDIFGGRAPLTPERQLRLAELTEQYERARAERRGVAYQPLAKVGDDGVATPSCQTCGKQPPAGMPLDESGKPPGWFSRHHDGAVEYACSAACIPVGEPVLPW